MNSTAIVTQHDNKDFQENIDIAQYIIAQNPLLKPILKDSLNEVADIKKGLAQKLEYISEAEKIAISTQKFLQRLSFYACPEDQRKLTEKFLFQCPECFDFLIAIHKQKTAFEEEAAEEEIEFIQENKKQHETNLGAWAKKIFKANEKFNEERYITIETSRKSRQK